MIRPRPHQSLQCRCVACAVWWSETYGANAERVRKALAAEDNDSTPAPEVAPTRP